MNTLLILASLLILIVYFIYVLSTKKFNYWKKKNVPYIKPLPILGNYGKYILQQEYVGEVMQKLCQQFFDQPYFGAFFGTEPVLIVQSPEIIKHVFIKDFYYFSGREISKYTSKEVITKNNMFFSGGDTWKVVRQTLTPLFSPAKMKNVFPLIKKCEHSFEDMLDHVTSISDAIEARDICARYTMDCICSCIFGVESNVMGQEKNNPFKIVAFELFKASESRAFTLAFRSIWPAIFYGIGLKLFPPVISSFFSKMLHDVFESRNYKPSSRNDFVDLLLNFKKNEDIVANSIRNSKTGDDKKQVHLKMDDDFMMTACTLLFAAGFETSATIMSFTLYEFAKNQEAQRRAAEEVDEYLQRHKNILNYDCTTDLPYLEACFYETMRLYPVLGNITREAMDDYVFPTGLQIDKGVRIHVPVYHMHRNPDYFPDPEKYKPERFLPENKQDLIPYTYFPFGEGPRICLGKTFAKMQVMSGLICVQKKYRVELAEGMPETVRLDARAMVTAPRNQGLHLKLVKRVPVLGVNN